MARELGKAFVLKNYGENPENYNEELKKLDQLRQAPGAFPIAYLRDSLLLNSLQWWDMKHQILATANINLRMVGEEKGSGGRLEKSMLDNRKSFLVARISDKVVDYYKRRAGAGEIGDDRHLCWAKIPEGLEEAGCRRRFSYLASHRHLHMGKQAEEQQKYGEQVAYLQSALDKLGEAIKQSKGQPTTVQDALRFTMDVIGGKSNSAKKDNDFIYHESVPALDTLQAVKGAPLVKALPVNPTDPAVTGPDIFSKLVPMAAHEASSLYSEEKAKLLRDIMSQIEAKNESVSQDSCVAPAHVEKPGSVRHILPAYGERCASARPAAKRLIYPSLLLSPVLAVLSGVFTDVEASLKDIKELLDEDERQEQKLAEEVGKQAASPSPGSPSVVEVTKEWAKYMEVHEKASFTNTELHKAMNLHISNLRLLNGPLEQLHHALPSLSLTEDDKTVLQNLKRILSKVQEMRDQRLSLEQQLRDAIQKDDITTSLVTTDRSEMKKLFAEQLKKYAQLKVYIDQNLSAQENILKALTDANVKYAPVRKVLTESEQKWNHTVQTLISSYEAYEDLMKKSQEGKDFYADLEGKVAKLLDKARAASDASQASRQQLLEREMKKKPPPRPTAPKPALQKKPSDVGLENIPAADLADMQQQFPSLFYSDLPEELKSLPPEALAAHFDRLPANALGPFPVYPANMYDAYRGRTAGDSMPGQHAVPFNQVHFNAVPRHMPQYAPGAIPGGPFPPVTYSSNPQVSASSGVPSQFMHASAVQARMPPQAPPNFPSQSPQVYPGGAMIRGPVHPSTASAPIQPGYPPPRTSPQHMPMPISGAAPVAPQFKPAVSGVAFGMGQQVRSSEGLPGVISTSAVRPWFHGPAHGSNGEPRPHGIRPATTTVDSIQGPISSYTTPRLPGLTQAGTPLNNQPMNQQMAPAHPHSGYMGPQVHSVMGQPGSFPYPQGGMQHYVQPPPPCFPHGQAPQMFQPQGQIPPRLDMQARPLSMPGQQHYAPSQPQFNAQMQPLHPQQPPVYQPRGHLPVMQPQQHFQHQNQFPIQHGMLPPQPTQQQALPPHSATLNFPGALPRVSPQPIQTIPPPSVHPSPQMHPRPAAQGMQALPSGSTAQIGSSQPFGPPPRHAVPPANALPNQMPVGSQMPIVGSQSAPSIPHHIQPPSSPAMSQLPGTVIVSGAPTTPSPAPSPQPSLVVQAASALPPTVPTSTAMPQRPPPSLTPGATPLTQGSTEVVFQRQSSSTDDLLSSSPESQHGGSKTSVGQPLLQPTKADSKDGQKPKGIQLIENDPYEKPEHIMRLLSELDRFRVVVGVLEKPVPGAATQLDSMWKEFQDVQEKEARHLSIAIARCYTMKNRNQDFMPYDKNRIVLQSGKDDYINASKIEDLSSYCPTIIATQAPLVGTASDFWLMIHEQKVSLIVMLVSELEMKKQKVMRYFPMERGQTMVHGHITLTLTSHKVTDTHVERVVALQYKDQSLKRSIIHLQFTSWPELGLPDSKGNLLHFIQEVHSHYIQQRPLHMPIVVHCSSGVGRTGALCLMYAAMQEVEAGNGIPDLAGLVKKMRQQRKHMLQEKLHLKFCYEAVLKHAEQVLQRHGVFPTPSSSSKPQNSTSQKVSAPRHTVLHVGSLPRP
ncbi:hypothetical protein FKM82_018484 [Ascaphus truei]